MDIVRIDHDALPPEERDAAKTVEDKLLHMQRAVQDFRHTFDLYAHAHERKLAAQNEGGREMWKMITWIHAAGRNGAIITYGFWMAMQEINSVNAPTLRGKIDMEERKKATRLFEAEFPKIAHIRTAAAHPGELESEAEDHRLKESGTSGAINADDFFGSFVGPTVTAENERLIYTASFKGALADYELSARKADALGAVAQHYCRAFYPLEDGISAHLRGERPS